jgi:hypothetical protein
LALFLRTPGRIGLPQPPTWIHSIIYGDQYCLVEFSLERLNGGFVLNRLYAAILGRHVLMRVGG